MTVKPKMFFKQNTKVPIDIFKYGNTLLLFYLYVITLSEIAPEALNLLRKNSMVEVKLEINKLISP